MPADLIPDIIAGLGFADDAAVIAWVVGAVREELAKFKGYSRCRRNPAVNRTGFLGDLIAWEDGVYGTSKSVFSGGA